MKEKRDLQIDVRSDKEFFDELEELAERIDNGWLPEKPVKRLYFDSEASPVLDTKLALC